MTVIRTIVVDDEPLARERLCTLLAESADFELVGQCADGRSALAAIEAHGPDLVFLDVQMPEMDGFEVIRAMPADVMPAVVFVTAYDQYALRAFEVHALDYLLKPFDRERFDAALGRARAQVAARRDGETRATIRELIETLRRDRGSTERLVIRSAGRIVFLPVEEIDWIEAAGNYLKVHAGDESHLLRETMSNMETRLAAAPAGSQGPGPGGSAGGFVRIHRSTIVNVDRIRELQPAFHGDYVVILRDGTQLAMSRGYRERLAHLIDPS